MKYRSQCVSFAPTAPDSFRKSHRGYGPFGSWTVAGARGEGLRYSTGNRGSLSMLSISRVGDFVLPTDIDLKAYQRLFVRRVVAEGTPTPARVLEIGPGPATDLVDNLPAREYWVVDPRPQWSRPNVRTVRGEIEDAPLPTNYFDVVCSVSVLEHIEHLHWPGGGRLDSSRTATWRHRHSLCRREVSGKSG